MSWGPCPTCGVGVRYVWKRPDGDRADPCWHPVVAYYSNGPSLLTNPTDPASAAVAVVEVSE